MKIGWKFSYDKAYIQMEKYNWKWFVVTDGAKGIHVINENKEMNIFTKKLIKLLM